MPHAPPPPPPVQTPIYLCTYIYDMKAPSFLEPHFLFADLAINSLARVGCHTSGLGSTRGHHALKRTYHLPLPPPPPMNFVFLFKLTSKFVT